jgi:hypothetical protein
MSEYDDRHYGSDGPVARHARRDIESDLNDIIDIVTNAKQMPLSASALVPRDELLAILDDALRNLPDEIREARRALRDREELMATEVRKAQHMMEQVRAEAQRMVEETEIVRLSRVRADEIIAEAQAKARALANQAEDFVDKKLGNFEIVLDRLLRAASSGRAKLATQPMPSSFETPENSQFFNEPSYEETPAPAPSPLSGSDPWASDPYDSLSTEASFFDQDAP